MDGVFLTGDGSDPDWVFDSRIDLKMQKNQARKELREAQAELEVATVALAAAEEDFRRFEQGAGDRTTRHHLLESARHNRFYRASRRSGRGVARLLDPIH